MNFIFDKTEKKSLAFALFDILESQNNESIIKYISKDSKKNSLSKFLYYVHLNILKKLGICTQKCLSKNMDWALVLMLKTELGS